MSAVDGSLPDGSRLLVVGFVVLSLALVALFVSALHTSARRAGLPLHVARRQAVVGALLAVAWLALTGLAAARGVLRFQSPPSMLALLPLILAVALGVALAPVGRQLALGLPIAALVGFQSFRVAVELLLHRAYSEGLMPVQMSYSGRNFDIVSGLTAIAVAGWLATGQRSPTLVRRVVWAWNLLGVALLANILAVALLSAPTPFRVFMNEPANVWVTAAPWIWLPAIMVLAAVLGHALVFRWLMTSPRAAPSPGSVAGHVPPAPDSPGPPPRAVPASSRR